MYVYLKQTRIRAYSDLRVVPELTLEDLGFLFVMRRLQGTFLSSLPSGSSAL